MIFRSGTFGFEYVDSVLASFSTGDDSYEDGSQEISVAGVACESEASFFSHRPNAVLWSSQQAKVNSDCWTDSAINI